MSSQPEFYEGQLSEESRQVREATESELERLYENLDELVGIPRIRALKKIDSLEQTLSWQGANPKKLDFEELRDHIHEGMSNLDSIERKYQERINNRATAIRAFCIQCQGGVIVGVRECPSVTCPLHPFRMGSDPFRGWDLPKPINEPELPDDLEEDVGEFEDEDDND